jgi:hypothetical protein
MDGKIDESLLEKLNAFAEKDSSISSPLCPCTIPLQPKTTFAQRVTKYAPQTSKEKNEFARDIKLAEIHTTQLAKGIASTSQLKKAFARNELRQYFMIDCSVALPKPSRETTGMSMHAICYFSSVTMLSKLQDRQPSRH